MFDIILTDNAWKYDNQKNNDPKMGGITYNVMNLSDLYNLNLSSISNKNSLLFSWSTMPKLKEGIEFIENNGFKYICCPFVWVKLNPTGEVIKQNKDILLKGGCYSGMGAYTAGNVELLLLGKKGKGLKRVRKDIKQVQFAPRGRHSQKPEIFQDMIELLYPELKYIELFARRERNNWICLGNEITNNDIRVDIKNLKGVNNG